MNGRRKLFGSPFNQATSLYLQCLKIKNKNARFSNSFQISCVHVRINQRIVCFSKNLIDYFHEFITHRRETTYDCVRKNHEMKHVFFDDFRKSDDQQEIVSFCENAVRSGRKKNYSVAFMRL